MLNSIGSWVESEYFAFLEQLWSNLALPNQGCHARWHRCWSIDHVGQVPDHLIGSRELIAFGGARGAEFDAQESKRL